jgi:hypothetical protein
MTLAITGPEERNRFVGCIDASITGSGIDFVPILDPAHPSARCASHLRLESHFVAPRRVERISRVSRSTSGAGAHLDNPLPRSCEVNENVAGADTIQDGGRGQIDCLNDGGRISD